HVGHFLPAYGSAVHPKVWQQAHWEQRAAHEYDYVLTPIWQDGLGIDRARNTAIESAIEADLDYLFMQDADTWAEDAVIPALIEALQSREATLAGAAYRLRRKTKDVAFQPATAETAEPGIHIVDRVGTGLICIDMRRLKDQTTEYPGPWCDRTYADPRQTTLALGGDYWLCDMVRHHGGKVVVRTDVRTGHCFRDIESLNFGD
ncbi:MAG: hypothetical protein R3258_09365, partial [Acidimicrobiia bacterium]|nr:hypothetical protein [Acidimicrobiia bacterium]